MNQRSVTLQCTASDASGNTASCKTTAPKPKPTPPPATDCGPCKGKVTELTLEYLGRRSAHVIVKMRNGPIVFQGRAELGQQFTFVGKDKKGTLGPEILLYVNTRRHTTIHTSCSKPIGPGLRRGNFLVVAGKSRNGGPLCPVRGGGDDDGEDDDDD